MREHGPGGRAIITVVAIGRTTRAVVAAAERYISPGAMMVADEARCYDALNGMVAHVAGVHHGVNYVGPEGESINQAESLFGLIQRKASGINHRIADTYLDWSMALLLQ